MGILDLHILESTENKKTLLIAGIAQANDVPSSVDDHVWFLFIIFYIIQQTKTFSIDPTWVIKMYNKN